MVVMGVDIVDAACDARKQIALDDAEEWHVHIRSVLPIDPAKWQELLDSCERPAGESLRSDPPAWRLPKNRI